MEREVIGSTGSSDGRNLGGGTPVSGYAAVGGLAHVEAAPSAAGSPPRVVDGRAEDRHPWAVVALVVPALFCAIVGVGVYLMLHRNMGYFKPAPVGFSNSLRRALAMAPPARSPAPETTSPLIRAAGRA